MGLMSLPFTCCLQGCDLCVEPKAVEMLCSEVSSDKSLNPACYKLGGKMEQRVANIEIGTMRITISITLTKTQSHTKHSPSKITNKNLYNLIYYQISISKHHNKASKLDTDL